MSCLHHGLIIPSPPIDHTITCLIHHLEALCFSSSLLTPSLFLSSSASLCCSAPPLSPSPLHYSPQCENASTPVKHCMGIIDSQPEKQQCFITVLNSLSRETLGTRVSHFLSLSLSHTHTHTHTHTHREGGWNRYQVFYRRERAVFPVDGLRRAIRSGIIDFANKLFLVAFRCSSEDRCR